MGYADIGEEEDWGRADQKSPQEADGHATSKKRKDGSTAGDCHACMNRAQLSMLRPCVLVANDTAICHGPQLTPQTSEAARGKVRNQILRPVSACKACSRGRLSGLHSEAQQQTNQARTS